MEKLILHIISLLIICIGFFMLLKPKLFANKLKKFYENYPIIHYAGENQFKSRLGFIRVTGIVVIIIGLICLFSV